MRPRKRREDGILCALPVAEDGGPTIQCRRLCREDLADHSECHARLVIAARRRAISASGAVGSAPCADGGAAASAGAGAGHGETFIRGSGADGGATFDAERDITVGARGETGYRLRPFLFANRSGASGRAVTRDQIGPTPP